MGPITGNFRLTFRHGVFGLGTAGSLIENATNTNSGGTTVTSGRVNVSTTGNLANADLVVNGGELNFNNAAQTVTGFSGTGGTVNLGAVNTLTVQQQAAGSYTGILAGSGSLVKKWSRGALPLAAPVQISSEPLRSRTVPCWSLGVWSGSVTLIAPSAVLGGTGTTGPVNVFAGTVDPGTAASPGLFTTFGDLTMNSGSTPCGLI